MVEGGGADALTLPRRLDLEEHPDRHGITTIANQTVISAAFPIAFLVELTALSWTIFESPPTRPNQTPIGVADSYTAVATGHRFAESLTGSRFYH